MKTYVLILSLLGLTALLCSVNLTAAKAHNIQPKKITVKPKPTLKPACSCGKRQQKGSDEARIVGGVEAVENEFPWRCNLREGETTKGGQGFSCGCSVLNERYVLTAAHCTNRVTTSIYVDAGDHDLTKEKGSHRQIIKVEHIYQHPQFNKTHYFDNDISILKLSKPLTINRYTSPICVPYQFRMNDFDGTTVTASGWGYNKEGINKTETKLRKVDLPVLTTTQCRQKVGQKITNNMICTYQQGKDTCQGDSGGSIDYKDPKSGKYYAIGIVSFGKGCARKDKPGVYAKVTQYLDFINSVTADSKICGRN